MMFECHFSHIIITSGSLKPQYTGPLGSRGKGIWPGKLRVTVNQGTFYMVLLIKLVFTEEN